MNQQAKPKIWKMLLLSWLFVYPIINLMFWLIFPLLKEQHQLVKTLVFTLILVPVMGIFIPKIHKKFWSWIVK
jgi:antibiotic biosynthesis monooxygenase (ABM) superfamily enzyme